LHSRTHDEPNEVRQRDCRKACRRTVDQKRSGRRQLVSRLGCKQNGADSGNCDQSAAPLPKSITEQARSGQSE
jgi:hypothetical protein